MSLTKHIRLNVASVRSALRKWKASNKKERAAKEEIARGLRAITTICNQADLAPFDPTRMDPLSWDALLARAGERWHKMDPDQRDPVRLLAEIERLERDRDAWRHIAEAP